METAEVHTRRVQRPIFDGFFDALLLLRAVPLNVCAYPYVTKCDPAKVDSKLQMVINYTLLAAVSVEDLRITAKKPIRLESVCCAI